RDERLQVGLHGGEEGVGVRSGAPPADRGGGGVHGGAEGPGEQGGARVGHRVDAAALGDQGGEPFDVAVPGGQPGGQQAGRLRVQRDDPQLAHDQVGVELPVRVAHRVDQRGVGVLGERPGADLLQEGALDVVLDGQDDLVLGGEVAEQRPLRDADGGGDLLGGGGVEAVCAEQVERGGYQGGAGAGLLALA